MRPLILQHDSSTENIVESITIDLAEPKDERSGRVSVTWFSKLVGTDPTRTYCQRYWSHDGDWLHWLGNVTRTVGDMKKSATTAFDDRSIVDLCRWIRTRESVARTLARRMSSTMSQQACDSRTRQQDHRQGTLVNVQFMSRPCYK